MAGFPPCHQFLTHILWQIWSVFDLPFTSTLLWTAPNFTNILLYKYLLLTKLLTTLRKKVKVASPQWLVLQYKRGHPKPPWFDFKPNYMQFWCFSTGAKPKNHRVFLLCQHWDWSHQKEGLFWWNCWKPGIDTQALSWMDDADLLRSG